MSKRNVSQPVPARVIRTAFLEGKFTAPDEALPSLMGKNGDGKVRGRIHPAAREAAEVEAGLVYREKVAEARTITIPVTKTNARGATLKRPVDVPLAEFRRLSGTAKGRPSKAALAKAAQAYMAEHGLK